MAVDQWSFYASGMTYRMFLSFLFSAVLSGQIASAQLPEPMDDNPDAGTGYVGVTGLVISEYLGSADEDFQVLPYLSFEDVKGFDLFGTALTYRLIEEGTGQGFGKWSLRAGPRIAYERGRDSDDSPTLTGFEDIDGSLPLGSYARGTWGPIGGRIDAGHDVIGGHDGFTVDASIGTIYRTDNIGIQPSLTVSWADDQFVDNFFGVSDAQSLASGLAPYNPDAGIYSYSANMLAWAEFEEKYAVVLTASYRWFTEDAADSPILNEVDGSTNGFFAGLSLTRKFDTEDWF